MVEHVEEEFMTHRKSRANNITVDGMRQRLNEPCEDCGKELDTLNAQRTQSKR